MTIKSISLFIRICFLAILISSCKSNSSPGPLLNSGKNIGPYNEPYRPQYHFSPPAHWMNDPNGMVYLDGEYHLFYQYYPDSTVWGPMHWGHAVSQDLIHWEHLPIALYPDSLGYIFSGSAVIDSLNTSGLGDNGKGPMIAMYTSHSSEKEKSGSTQFENQSIAYSNDRGRTWKKYKDNPVISNPGIRDFRDTKVIWHEGTKKWVVVFAATDHLTIYTSPDMKHWTHVSDFGKEYGNHKGVWECPDLFPVLVENSREVKWVLLQSINPGGPNGGSATQYFVGDFDGKKFTIDPAFENKVKHGNAVWVDQGKDNYAGVTWSGIPASDGRSIFLGWMSNWQYAEKVPSTTWRSANTIPRELILEKSTYGYRLKSLPIKELDSLETNTRTLPAATIDTSLLIMEHNPTARLELTFKKPRLETITIRLSNTAGEYCDIGYDPANQTYFIDRDHAGKKDFSNDFSGRQVAKIDYESSDIKFLLLLDHASVELFADRGRCVMTAIFFPSPPFDKAEIIKTNESIALIEGKISALKRIW
ncbi:MAG: glycoside hydrolase family 32 protein [Saprospiraceae bacterium]